jgi:DNA polymerase-4
MDAVCASVEERDRPELMGKPVIVGSSPEKRGVVSAANYNARRYGMHSAVSSAVDQPSRLSHKKRKGEPP